MYQARKRPGRCTPAEPDIGERNIDLVNVERLADRRQAVHPVSPLHEARDRIEVWVALLTLLDTLRARVGRALDEYESDLVFDEQIVQELTHEVETFSAYAAHRWRQRQP